MLIIDKIIVVQSHPDLTNLDYTASRNLDVILDLDIPLNVYFDALKLTQKLLISFNLLTLPRGPFMNKCYSMHFLLLRDPKRDFSHVLDIH